MSEHTEYQARIRREARRRARKRRYEDRLVALLVILGGLGGLVALVGLVALLGGFGIYVGWNLGVYGLAHAVHTDVLRISYGTAIGASLAIGVLGRVFRAAHAVKVDVKKT